MLCDYPSDAIHEVGTGPGQAPFDERRHEHVERISLLNRLEHFTWA